MACRPNRREEGGGRVGPVALAILEDKQSDLPFVKYVKSILSNVASVFSKSGKHKGELVEILKVLDVKELKILKFPSSDVVVSWTMLSESMGELCFIGGHVQRNLAARKVLLVRSKSQIWSIPLMYTFLRYWRHTTL